MKVYMFRIVLCALLVSCTHGCSSPTQKAYEDAVAREIAIDDEFADLQIDLWKASLDGSPPKVHQAIDSKMQSLNKELDTLAVRLSALRPHKPNAIKFADMNDKTEELMQRQNDIANERGRAFDNKDLAKIIKLCEEEREVQKQLSKYTELRAMYRNRE